jgi:hypothetical protein
MLRFFYIAQFRQKECNLLLKLPTVQESDTTDDAIENFSRQPSQILH